MSHYFYKLKKPVKTGGIMSGTIKCLQQFLTTQHTNF